MEDHTEELIAESKVSETSAKDVTKVEVAAKVESKPEKMPESNPKKVEKTKEEIMAEREAKKAAKAAKKAGTDKVAPDAAEKKPENKVEKSKEEIKAEREAKKAEKAARRKDAVEEKEGDKKEPVKPPQEKQGQGEGSKPDKSKAELKAERRAKQEAQRAAKMAEAEKKETKATSKPAKARVPDDIQADRISVEKKLQKKLASAQIPARTQAQRKVMLFSHLHQYERELSISRELPVVGGNIHPAVVELGLQLAEGIISGSNARCVAFMNVMAKVIRDYVTPPQKELSRDLDSKLKPYITFLRQCRTLSVSMGNAIRFLKARINGLEPGLADQEAKEILLEAIESFVHENVVLAAKQIAITAREKIRDGDVILTYGYSSLPRSVLVDAAQSGRKFRVIIADGRPKFEGREMARNMVNAGIKSSYIQVSTVPYVMPEVTKVLLGAHAVLANGSVLSGVGTAQVALTAKASNVPVLVCCETYKFSERVQTDSFVFNELGDPDDLVETGKSSVTPLDDWRDLSSLTLLNLTYDITPASLVDVIISEVSVIPTTSVPVILRLKNMDQAYH